MIRDSDCQNSSQCRWDNRHARDRRWRQQFRAPGRRIDESSNHRTLRRQYKVKERDPRSRSGARKTAVNQQSWHIPEDTAVEQQGRKDRSSRAVNKP